MVYPNSPFTNLNNSTIVTLFNSDNSLKFCENNVNGVLKWLCVPPKISSFRINTLKVTKEEAKKLVENCLKKVSQYQHKLHCVPTITTHPLLPDVILINSYPSDKLILNKSEKEVIVDAACGTAILRGAHVYAPGVMAMQTDTKLNDVVSVYADISKKCKKGLKIIYDCPQKVFVGNGIVKMVRNELFGNELNPGGIAIEIIDSISGCPSLNDNNFPTGQLLLQNIPSIICSYVLNPKPGDIILDMCASPGNKTSHIAALMNNTGTLIALDKTSKKLKQLQMKCEDFGLKCVYAFEFDATKSCDSNIEGIIDLFKLQQGPPFPEETFDKILLDAPCSGLGNRPQLLNTITDKVVRSYVPLQRKLFTNAVKLLKTGGHLVYSTCTITLGENEGIVAWALDNFDCLKLVLTEPIFGGSGWTGTNLTNEQLKLVQRFGPDQNVDSTGFFIAHFIKK